jgi:hypothetical protein
VRVEFEFRVTGGKEKVEENTSKVKDQLANREHRITYRLHRKGTVRAKVRKILFIVREKACKTSQNIMSLLVH